ncbi:helix-turn-helix domain-containing protein [Streptomyces sp. NPDC019531]|uniref:helix-turn-helix domain-containing protein n=1 Tax=Streptomyces sp. NPDC019531 TaxID=3365062 RepID=UPI00384CF1F9
MKEIPCDFGSELRRRRGERGFSLTAYSRMISCSKSHLSKMETGQAMPSREFAKVCDEVLAANGELVALVSGEGPRGTRRSKMSALVGLPSSPSHFVGRSELLARIVNCLTDDCGSTVCAVSGMAGVGKTALVLRGAWNAADSFPDGCFFFDFGEESPGGARDILDSLLRLLGVPKDRIPSRPDAMANLWRSQLSGKRLLLVLDNVPSMADIAPLLSAEPGCRFLVASRRRLSALDDAVHLSVGVLIGAEADVLFRTVGGDRAAHAADQVVRAVVEHCGRLLLAVRIAAARFRSAPSSERVCWS